MQQKNGRMAMKGSEGAKKNQHFHNFFPSSVQEQSG
jgi:hypothetical protein